ncbi:MAG: fibronectin type III domain-containing protein, partial [Acidobacteria bacterium]|nr:fibronectin type III domain-containing protein [Acidobacteriota bacterium]
APAAMFQHTPAGGPPMAVLPEVQLAHNANLLFVRRGGTGGAPETVVLAADTGALVRSLPDLGSRPNGLSSLDDTHWLVDPEATRLVVHLDARVDVRDATTGAAIGGTPVSGPVMGFGTPPFTTLAPDWSFERVLAFQGQPSNWTLSLVDGTGQLIGETLNRGYCRPALQVSPHTGRGYLLYNSGGGGKYYGAIQTELAAFDGATLQFTSVRDITDGFGFSTDLCNSLRLNLATAPGAPRGLSATVSGRDVTLSWVNVGDATAFVLEAGLAPGRRDLTVPIGTRSPATIVNAPPGTYYLRVRGTNAFGVGRPSNDVAVVVR